ncbi:Crp/Fnr family transcriptional regulator [Parachitinimonas caeni]|uniref:Cyclic nucleotide-binding domain-containing protein n=1 Tax=Parachitinimonas caeni TaxID=3031301 RepID=A0ABT7DTS4_9NEIS|nr:cyclic nucleotide-binding domain-containing protein [Parachitinimonas caeni]MDK2123431.1 cyclic nucleotide-binding domain-containing protein [Parachitinimonas caeni]
MSITHVVATNPVSDYELVGAGIDHLSEIHDALLYTQLFRQMDTVSLEILAEYLTVYKVAAGRPLLKEGETSDFSILLLSGSVEVLKKPPRQNAPRLIATVTRGKLIGEMSLVDGEPRFASCIAGSEATFAVLSRADMLRLLDEHPKLGSLLLMQLISLLSQRLRQTSRKLVGLMASTGKG